MLKARNLSAIRGGRILFKKISFELTAGKLLRIGGENGSGKTILLRILAGLSQADSGSLHWGQQTLQQAGEGFFGALAYLAHLNGLQAELTARENLLLGRRQGTVDCSALLRQVGLRKAAEVPARFLSQGQRRRLALAMLLGKNASLWILDEPLTSLDQVGIDLVLGLCRAHLSKGGMIVLATHQEMEFPVGVSQLIRLGE